MKQSGKPIFECKPCKYICHKKSDFMKHTKTTKHKQMSMPEKDVETFECSTCGSMYASKSGLWKHKKRCNVNTTTTEESPVLDDIHSELIKQNKELKNMLIRQQEKHTNDIEQLIPQLKQVTNVTNVTNVTHQTNKFNLNFFLNEQCKDAMSVQNFIQNIQVGIKELEHIGSAGFANGMMTILTKSLNDMDLYQRPLHCTDLKRETLYIKQGDRWERDTDEKTELRKLIKAVEEKNYENMSKWEQDHPTALECDTEENKRYLQLMEESLGGNEEENTKVVKHIVKEVYINR